MIHNLFSLGNDHFFRTVGWRRVVNDNGIGSSLPEIKSFILSLSQINPMNCILEDFPLRSCTVPFVALTRLGIFLLRVDHEIHDCEE